MRSKLLAVVLFAACGPAAEEGVAKRDTGVAPARVTTETPTAAGDTISGVRAVPSEGAVTGAQKGQAPESAVLIRPPAESLRTRPE